VAEVSVKTFSQEIIEDLQMENELRTEYTKLLASAKIFFDGEERKSESPTSYNQGYIQSEIVMIAKTR